MKYDGRDNIQVWITVPTKYLKANTTYHFLVNRFRPDMQVLGERLSKAGFQNVELNWYDPRKEKFGEEHRKQIRNADIMMFYLVPGKSSFFGRGAHKIYYTNEHKPCYIMYHTRGTDKLKFYEPHLKGKTNGDNWHNYVKIQFGMDRSIDYIITEMDNTNDKPEVEETAELVSATPQQASRWIYLYTSIFNNYEAPQR